VWGEGLHVRPKTAPVALVIALPDADQTPEMLAGLAPGLAPERQFARRLAEQGCEVLVLVLLDRRPVVPSGPSPEAMGTLSRRDFVARQAFPLGRHIIGYEVQKVLAGIDVLLAGEGRSAGGSPRIGVAGYGEGGLTAFYSAALDTRISAVLVSGDFDSRPRLGDEPFSRLLFGFQREFGDAEIATLIAPRGLIVEYSLPPDPGGLAPADAALAAAPVRSRASDYASVEAEFDRAQALMKPDGTNGLIQFTLISGTEGMATGPGSDRALTAFLNALGCSIEQLKPAGALADPPIEAFSAAGRQERQFEQLERFNRRLAEKIERGVGSP
jgi:hypothetical protein